MTTAELCINIIFVAIYHLHVLVTCVLGSKGGNQWKNTMILGKVLTKPIFCIFSRAQAVSQQALFINKPTSFSRPTSQTCQLVSIGSILSLLCSYLVSPHDGTYQGPKKSKFYTYDVYFDIYLYIHFIYIYLFYVYNIYNTNI